MQKRICNRIGSLTLSGLLATALVPAASSVLLAQQPTRSASGIEKSLAGIRILQSYKTVLDRFGAPNRIFRKDDLINYTYARDANGLMTGGIVGFGEPVSGGGATLANAPAAGAGGGMSGMMGMGGGMPGGGAPAMAAMMSQAMGRGGGGMSGGMGGPPPGIGGMMSAQGRGGGLPGFSGSKRGGGEDDGGSPGATMASGGGGMGAGSASAGSTFGDSGGFIWSYLDPRSERATNFHFNKDGRVEAISEFGRFRSSISSRGISIESQLSDVYRAYGWPDSTRQINGGEMMVLSYLQKNHFQVVLVKDKAKDTAKVVALVVTLRENQTYALTQTNTGGTGAGGGAMRGGAAMGGGMAAMMGAGVGMPGGPSSKGGAMFSRPGAGAGGGKKGM